MRAGVVNVARWVRDSGFTNVVLEIAKESAHPGFDHPILTDIRGNNPVHVLGKEHSIDPPGPDGAPAATDAVAFGKYVRRSTRQSPDNPHYPYSLQFNVNSNGDIPELPLDAFWKAGSGGHAIYIVPSLDLVWKLSGRDGQFSPENTGLPPSPAAQEQVAARGGWKETVDSESALRTTLKMVIESMVKPGSGIR